MDIRDSYNQICDAWDAFRKSTPVNPCIASFAERLPSGASVLDVGCGTGYPVDAYLAEKGFRVIGIDVSEKMIEKARAQRLRGSAFFRADILNFQPARTYDAVIAMDSLWHIAHDRQAELYSEISSLLHTGGWLFFTHGKKDGEVTGEMFGETFYYSALDKDTVLSLLAQNGFQVISLLEDYEEATTGDRELMVTARKIG